MCTTCRCAVALLSAQDHVHSLIILTRSALPLCTQWFDDCDPEVRTACRAAVALLSAQGAAVDVTMVVPELEQLRVAHTVTIVSEMFNNFRVSLAQWKGRVE